MRNAFLLLSALLLFACSSKKQGTKDITGQWKPVAFISDKVNEKEVQEMLQTASVEFTADHKYNSYVSGKKEEEGSFTLDEKQQQLTVTNRSENQVYTISWAGDTMVLSNTEKETMKLLKK
ncbi:MAG: lipocalin family protein [Chitinophagaceae bacterium]|nr:lipocalin family protein [Chitinophagaceae bacterium]